MMHAPRRTRSTLPRAAGYTLIHTLVVLSIIAVFAMVSSELMMDSIRLMREYPQRQTSILELEQAMVQLRRDVWSAAAIRRPDPEQLVIEPADGPTITWRTNVLESGLVRTVEGGASRLRWTLGMHDPAYFENDGAVVRLKIGEDQATLVSQLQVAREDER